MKANHYYGQIVEGYFEDRVYLDTFEESLQSTLFKDFKNEDVVIEMWVTTEPKDFYQLDELAIDFNAHQFLRLYSQFRVVVTKPTLLALFGNTRIINNMMGNYLYLIITVAS